MEYQEQTVKVDSATFGDKTYNKTTTNGTEAVSIIDKEYMYAIDHNTKSVIKMSMANINQPSVDTMIEEGDINMDELVKGSREINGKTYETEEWLIDGMKSIMCFDGDNLAYMISELEGEEYKIKVTSINKTVDESLFEIPKDYTVTEI